MSNTESVPNIFHPGDLLRVKIEHFIFHVIKTDKDTPLLLDAVNLTQHQLGFFIDRFADAAKQLVEYEFTDPASSTIVDRMTDLLDHPPSTFVPVSKELATSFHSHHKSQMADGIMSIAFATLDNVPLLIILKLDHKEVLQYRLSDSDENVTASLEYVPNTVVQGKDALQKMAIIDLSDHFEWDVLATDRTTSGQRVSQYFEQFLNMRQMETPVMIMQSALRDVQQWSTAHSDQLDPEQHVTDYRERAIRYMDKNTGFETSGFLDFVVQDDNPERKTQLKDSLFEELAESGLHQKSFGPRPETLRKSHRRHQLKTEQGVRLEWYGSLDENNMTITEPRHPGGQFEILIRTGDMDVF